MTRSIRKAQKRLRKKAKPHDCHAQSPNYWFREIKNRDKVKDHFKELNKDHEAQ